MGVIFAAAALAWVFIPLILDWTGSQLSINDSLIGIAAGLLMFIVPANFKTGERILDWRTAGELPWDVLLLFGGGLSLSAMFTSTGLSLWIGELAKGLDAFPIFLLIFAIAVLVLFLTEFTSNTAQMRKNVKPHELVAKMRDVNYGQKATVLTGHDQTDV